MISQRFLKYIEENKIFTKSNKILVGCSGGADSIMLVYLLLQNNYNFSIAHMNFNLRGEESDNDRNFVEYFATNNNIPFFEKSVNTKEYALENKISIEMAARDLRYSWFSEIIDENNFDYVAIAHNQDDNIETFFINLSRKTGIRGLSGIKIKTGKIVRPLLFLSKDEIRNYLNENNIKYRNDSTNFENIYQRNKIRNIIIPEFERINSGFRKNIIENIKINSEIEQIYLESIENQKKQCLEKINNHIKIDITKIKNLNSQRTYLFEFLRDYNFNSDIVDDILKNLDADAGKIFYSSSHILLKDRDYLIVKDINESIEDIEFTIEDDEKNIHFNKDLVDEIYLEITDFKIDESFEISKLSNIGFFDFDKILFPLKLRKWKKSDRFIPLGMNNFKKVSDFLIDNKVNIFDKENLWILESNNQIIWIINYRIDNRFKISDKTRKVMKISVE